MHKGKSLTPAKPGFTFMLSLTLAFALGAVLVTAVGENPWQVLGVFYNGAFGTTYDLGFSVFYALPLACTGLAVSIGLRSKLFNIGVEGQLTVATLAATLAGLYGPQEIWLNRGLGLLTALAAGGLWALLLGYLRARRHAHEVVVGIMLNFVAFALTSWLALNFFKNPKQQNPETEQIAEVLQIPHWNIFEEAPIGWYAGLVPLAALLVWVLYRWTRLGFALEVIGDNQEAAEQAGLSIPSLQMTALGLGGALAGLVGFMEVYGNSGRFIVGFSPGYGFIGIAVALIGRLKPAGILLAALLFGAMHKGSLDLDFETEHITRDLAMILQAILILLVSCTWSVPQFLQRWLRPSQEALRGSVR